MIGSNINIKYFGKEVQTDTGYEHLSDDTILDMIEMWWIEDTEMSKENFAIIKKVAKEGMNRGITDFEPRYDKGN